MKLSNLAALVSAALLLLAAPLATAQVLRVDLDQMVASTNDAIYGTIVGNLDDADFALNLGALVPPNTISPGETWGLQFWYRNPAAGGANSNASNGLAVELCP